MGLIHRHNIVCFGEARPQRQQTVPAVVASGTEGKASFPTAVTAPTDRPPIQPSPAQFARAGFSWPDTATCKTQHPFEFGQWRGNLDGHPVTRVDKSAGNHPRRP